MERAQGLLQHFLEAGPCSHGAMGPVPLQWAELAQWQRLTRTPLHPWQARALRQASAAYVGQLHDAAAPDCPPPWSTEPDDADRDRVARQVRNALGGRPQPRHA